LPEVRDLNRTNLTLFLTHYPQNLALALGVLIYHLSSSFFVVAVSAVTLQIMGFRAESNFHQPIRAKSYSQFLSRVMHIYNKNLRHLFLFPLRKLLRRVPGSERRPVIIFLSVFFGGLFLNIPVTFLCQTQPSLEGYLDLYMSFVPYFFALALTSMISNLVETRLDYSHESRLLRSLRIFLYFNLYGVISVLGIWLKKSDVYFKSWQIFLSFFGF
jgi:hypothetical protein